MLMPTNPNPNPLTPNPNPNPNDLLGLSAGDDEEAATLA